MNVPNWVTQLAGWLSHITRMKEEETPELLPMTDEELDAYIRGFKQGHADIPAGQPQINGSGYTMNEFIADTLNSKNIGTPIGKDPLPGEYRIMYTYVDQDGNKVPTEVGPEQADSIVAALEPEEEPEHDNRLLEFLGIDPNDSDVQAIRCPTETMDCSTDDINQLACSDYGWLYAMGYQSVMSKYVPPQIQSFDEVMAPILASFPEDQEILDQVKAACEAKDAERNAAYANEGNLND